MQVGEGKQSTVGPRSFIVSTQHRVGFATFGLKRIGSVGGRLHPSRRFDVLASSDDAQRAAVAAVASERVAAAGDELTRSGEFGYHLYFVEEGEVEVLRGGEVIATLGAGSHFGEVALMVTW